MLTSALPPYGLHPKRKEEHLSYSYSTHTQTQQSWRVEGSGEPGHVPQCWFQASFLKGTKEQPLEMLKIPLNCNIYKHTYTHLTKRY